MATLKWKWDDGFYFAHAPEGLYSVLQERGKFLLSLTVSGVRGEGSYQDLGAHATAKKAQAEAQRTSRALEGQAGFGALKSLSLEASIKKRASKTRSAAEVEILRDSLKSASMDELLEDGPHWIYARRGQDIYRVAFSRRYDSGFRFECTINHWLAHQPYPGNH